MSDAPESPAWTVKWLRKELEKEGGRSLYLRNGKWYLTYPTISGEGPIPNEVVLALCESCGS